MDCLLIGDAPWDTRDDSLPEPAMPRYGRIGAWLVPAWCRCVGEIPQLYWGMPISLQEAEEEEEEEE